MDDGALARVFRRRVGGVNERDACSIVECYDEYNFAFLFVGFSSSSRFAHSVFVASSDDSVASRSAATASTRSFPLA